MDELKSWLDENHDWFKDRFTGILSRDHSIIVYMENKMSHYSTNKLYCGCYTHSINDIYLTLITGSVTGIRP